MTNRDDFLFTLVLQLDRRKQPDRRAAWRGSRRAADQLAASPLAVHTPTLWTRALDDGGRGVEKGLLH